MFTPYSNRKKESREVDQKSIHTSYTKSESFSSLDHFQLKASQPIGVYSTSQIFQLQKSIGNNAVTQLLHPQEGSYHTYHPPVQRVIQIGDETYTHGSRKKVNYLFDHIVAPLLEREGYKTYGIKSKLVEYIRDNNNDFTDVDAFLDTFMRWLEGQERNVKGGGKTSVLKRFDISRMARPKWNEKLKEELGFEDGDNIRHVIRNATLKRALKIEYDRPHIEDRDDRIREIAEHIGLSTDATIDVIAQKIYNEVYLNEANLFSGDGAYNQIIGFAADQVKRCGEDLLNSDELVNPLEIAEGVKRLVMDASGQTKFGRLNPVTIDLCNIIDTVINEKTFEGDSIDYVEAEYMGDLIMDIGLNLGFDLIDGRVPADQINIAERQGELLQIETELQNFISSNGSTGSLKDIFKKFLEIER